MDRITQLQAVADVNNETLAWASAASREDVGVALDIGYYALNRFKTTKQAAPVQVAVTECTVASVRGQIGESHVEAALIKRFGTVRNVTKTAKSGDLTLYLQHIKVVVEVKNYSGTVPVNQIEKFQNDLNTTNAGAGVFVSLRSPIVGMDSFNLRYEYTETKTIPCVYLTTADESMIAASVSMVQQLAYSLESLAASAYDRDRIVSSVYGITDRLEEVSKARNDLQAEVGNITNRLVRTSINIASAEANMRRDLDAMRCELMYAAPNQSDANGPSIDANPYFAKYTDPIKLLIRDVLSKIQNVSGRREGVNWKHSAKKCLSIGTGIYVNFNAVPQICIPRAKITSAQIIAALDKYGNKVTVSDVVCVELDDVTKPWIDAHISCKEVVTSEVSVD